MELESTVWIGKWKQAEEATLRFSNGHLRLQSGQRCLFDAPQEKFTSIVWHWYSFGGALEASIDGASYFLSFVPRYARLGEWYAGLAVGHKWKAALAGKAAPARSPLFARLLVSFVSLMQAFFYAVGGIMVMIQVADEKNAMWIRIAAGLLELCLLYLIFYLLWQAVRTPFRRD